MNKLLFLSDVIYPRTMIITISVSVIAVLLLAAFVLYMWQSQQRSADVAKEVRRITDSIEAGIVNFVCGQSGRVTYMSQGFFKIIGYSREEVREVFDNNFYMMIDSRYSEIFRRADITPGYTFSEEMQINTGEGPKWVIVSGNGVQRRGKIMTISAVIVDITEKKKLAEQIALQQERYKLATELSNDVILNYSIVDDTLNISENFRTYYGGPTCIPNFSAEKMWEKGMIFPEDTEKVAELFRIITLQGGGVDQQIRVRNDAGAFIWCRLICKPIKDSDGESREFVGKLINIDLHKKELSMLEKKAMRDPLTGAYNKEYTRTLINKYITENPENPGMLLLVDIDRFKNINDTYGHPAGDKVIIEVVRQVTAAFRANDIVGRIGGDEFVVFVCNVRNADDQIKQAKKLHEVLGQPVVYEGTTIAKSASIGVAIYPGHADNYDKLIECADKALYDVKGSGKDSFKIYGT